MKTAKRVTLDFFAVFFPTDFDLGKKYALFCTNRIRHNHIGKCNQSFGYGNYIKFETSEGQLNVSFFI